MKKVKKSKPTHEMLNSFKEISKFVSNTHTEKDTRVNNVINKKQKIKMPFKMYMGIKKAVLKKHEKEKEYRQKVNLIYHIYY
jgi:hypothetical protein